MDDGPLSKDFCEDEQNFDDTITTQIDPCCACAEAKYEVWPTNVIACLCIMYNHFIVNFS